MITNHSGISGSRTAYMLTAGIKEKHKLLAVVPSGQAAARLADDLVFYMLRKKTCMCSMRRATGGHW